MEKEKKIDSEIDSKISLTTGLELLSQYTIFQYKEALETLHVYIRNLIDYPTEKKYQKVKLSNIHFQERLGSLEGATECMGAIGYTVQGDYLRLAQPKQLLDRLHELVELRRILTQQHETATKKFSALPKRIDIMEHKFQSVTGAGEHSAQGRRPNMEDDDIMVDQFCGIPTQGYFGLYDGHGGRGTVDFVVKVLHQNLEHIFKTSPSTPPAEAYENSYLITDAQLRRQSMLRSGTTSVSCLIRVLPDGSRMLYHANVGDSRAVLCRGTEAKRLTIDHKPNDPDEMKRIKAAGGKVGGNRVCGVLAISRALGDHVLKENNIVTASPFCGSVLLNEDDEFLILACDGVWDVMTDQDAVDLLHQCWQNIQQQGRADEVNSAMREISKAIVDRALALHTGDNVSVMCIKLY